MSCDETGSAVLFRVEGGRELGWGHLARCSALAEAFCTKGHRVVFAAGSEAAGWVADQGFSVRRLEEASNHESELRQVVEAVAEAGARAVVVDLPDRPGKWRRMRRGLVDGLAGQVDIRVVMEDLSSKEAMGAELVVNPNAGAAGNGSGRLSGLSFQPIRQVFIRQPAPFVRPEIEQVLVCLGGGRQDSLLTAVIGTLRAALPPKTRVILAAARDRDHEGRAAPLEIGWLEDPESLPHEAARSDLAVVGGGQLKYELACLGVPAVVLPVAADQRPSCEAWAQAGGPVVSPGYMADLFDTVSELLGDRERRSRLASWGRSQVDGRGARRIVDRVVDLLDGR